MTHDSSGAVFHVAEHSLAQADSIRIPLIALITGEVIFARTPHTFASFEQSFDRGRSDSDINLVICGLRMRDTVNIKTPEGRLVIEARKHWSFGKGEPWISQRQL